MNYPALEVSRLTVSYHDKPVLVDIDFQLSDSHLVGIVGPNGAGKSTLIKAIMGLLPVDRGEIRLWGGSLAEQRKRIGYVPQRESVDWDFPVNAYDVVMMGCYGRLGWFRRPGKPEQARVMESLAKVGMLDFASRQISELSGGQQQRIFLARALAQDAQLYLLDEPFVGVDASTEATLVELLREMRTQKKLVLVVHHDLSRVRDYFDQVILLNNKLHACGPVPECFTPELLSQTYGGRLSAWAVEAVQFSAE